MYSGQTQITSANADTLLLLQMVQEAHDQGGVDLLEVQLRRRFMQSLLSELQQLTESVAIGTDGVGTGLALLHQPASKEALQDGCQTDRGVHGRPSQRRSSRRIASRISSGQASKYHCVSATWTWPR